MPEENSKSKQHADSPREINLGLLLSLLFLSILIPISTKFNNMSNMKKAEYQKIIEEEKQLQEEVNRLEQENKKMVQESQTLRTHRGVEQIARNKLGLIKSNEIPFVVREGNEYPRKNLEDTTEKQEKDNNPANN